MTYRITILFLLITSCLTIEAQSTKINMNSKNWKIIPEAMSFEEFDGQNVLLIKGDGEAILQNRNFSSGTIEFDFYPTERRFCGIYFRRDEGENRKADFFSDYLYLRTFKMDDAFAPGSVQYAPIVRGTNLWDLLHDYEANALVNSNSWNKIKLLISKKQLKCYINDELVLWIPELMGKNKDGLIAFEGPGRYANLKISDNAIEDLPNSKGADLSAHDVRYLRDWEYTGESTIEKSTSLAAINLPDSAAVWKTISASRFGLLNLTDKISSPFIKGERHVIWLRTTVASEIDQIKNLKLGFSDDVAIFANGRLVHTDMNTYASPISKNPNGRIHVDNIKIFLPLQSGENEILIALANDFFGWGLIARLNDMNGIKSKMVHR